MSNGLIIEFCGEEHRIEPDRTFTFGRSADLDIDDNRFLHRTLGEFAYESGLWWVRNLGSNISLALHDTASTSAAKIAPGTSAPLTFRSTIIRFEAGGSTYELTAALPSDPSPMPIDDPPLAEAAEMTTTTSSLPLTPEQLELLEALAGPLLATGELPTNRELASELGWTITKYNRKLDGLCAKYAKAGVHGLRGSADRLAKDRRVRLAEHVIDAGIVAVDDLTGSTGNHDGA